MHDDIRQPLTPDQISTLSPDHFHERARRVGLPVIELCRRAAVSEAMYYKWKRNAGDVTWKTLRKLATQLWAAEVVHQLSSKKDPRTQPESR